MQHHCHSFPVLLFAVASAAQSTAAVEAAADRVRSMQRRHAEQLSIVHAAAQRLQRDRDARRQKVAELQDELQRKVGELSDEKERTRRELAAGLYCSKCKRSKSRIERELRIAFAQHLDEVQGIAVPMSTAEIAAEMKRYDQQIAGLEQQLGGRIENLIASGKAAEQALRDQITQGEVRTRQLDRGIHAAIAQLGEAIGEYRKAAEQADLEFLAGWEQRAAREEADADLREFQLALANERANDALQQALRRGADRATAEAAAGAAGQALADLQRERTERERTRDRDYKQAFAAWRQGREANELHVGSIGREFGIYVASTLPTARALAVRHAGTPPTERARRLFEQFAADRAAQADPAADWRTVADFLDSTAVDLRRNAGALAERFAERARDVANDVRESTQAFRDFVREQVVPAVRDTAVESIVLDRELPTASGLAEGVAIGIVVEQVQTWLVDTLREAVLARSAPEDRYLNTFEVELLSPKHGIAAWHNPFKPDSVKGIFDWLPFNEIFELPKEDRR